MTILNLTPDSFSDGGAHFNIPASHLAEKIRSHIASGTTILDLGGQSTRPGARQVSSNEEMDRVVPAVEIVKSIPEAEGVAISVDTYRADVAEAAIKAGAHIVNDVSAGLLDPNMLSTVARLGATVCLMHMRGTPETMNGLTDYPDGVIAGVATELLERVREAEEVGIRRWRIILDPGIGFAKNQEQNLELLRGLDKLRNWPGLQGFPWLVGASRKAFVGRITGVKEAREGYGVLLQLSRRQFRAAPILCVCTMRRRWRKWSIWQMRFGVTDILPKRSHLVVVVEKTARFPRYRTNRFYAAATHHESFSLPFSIPFDFNTSF